MPIIRVTKQKNFSIVSNVVLNDPNLSLKANSKSSISSGLTELRDAGYKGGAE